MARDAEASSNKHRDPLGGLFERYRPIVDDWAAFVAALFRPQPPCFWTNTLRVTPDQLAAVLGQEGVAIRPLSWLPSAFRTVGALPPGRRWWYQAGLCHFQEEVSMLPVHLLAPQPGERVLDLCASPGGKTAQIAMALNNEGTVVANDNSVGRSRALRANIERLGLANVSTTIHDGANYPPAAGSFDRVLVDAPCTSEGAWRKNPEWVRHTGESASLRRSRLQRALLRKAIQLCRPGGRIVYATCTFAPEENEMVVDAVMREGSPYRLQLLDARVQGFHGSPGITKWKDQQLLPELAATLRAWPHHNDSGGFFVAVLQKGGQEPAGPPETLHTPSPISDELWKPDLVERFGLPDGTFDNYLAYQRTRRGVHLVDNKHLPPSRPSPDTSGFFFLRTDIKFPKLTTTGAMILGPKATRNVVDMTASQRDAYMAHQNCYLSDEQRHRCTDTGYVIARYGGLGLGVGLYRSHTGELESLFPKRWGGR